MKTKTFKEIWLTESESKIYSSVLKLGICIVRTSQKIHSRADGQDVFGYDIYGCSAELKGQLKIGDFCGQ